MTNRATNELRRALAASDYDQVTVDVGTETVSISRKRLTALVADDGFDDDPLTALARLSQRLDDHPQILRAHYSGQRDLTQDGDGNFVAGKEITTTLSVATRDPAYKPGGPS